MGDISAKKTRIRKYLRISHWTIFSLMFIFFAGKATPLQAQDLLFSQMYANPSYFNPSMSGVYDALYRISLQHRSQWNSVLDHPYKTYGVSGDARLEIGRDRNKMDAFSLGALFLSDKVSRFDFSKTTVALMGAFHKNMGGEHTQFLSAGFSIGMNQQNINYENLRFQDQFDGTVDFSLGTAETLPDNNFSYPNLAIGINYTYREAGGIRFNAGASILNVLEPNLSYYQEPNNPNYTGEDNNTLYQNFIGHFSMETAIVEDFWISPRILASFQGPHTQYFGGTGFRFLLNDSRASYLHFGLFTRINNRLDELKFRDISTLVGFEIEGIRLGLSYDLSLDDLNNYSQQQGIFELSITIMGEFYNEYDLCPHF